MYVNGRNLEPSKIHFVGHIELGYGRSSMLSDVMKEYQNRATNTYHSHLSEHAILDTTWRSEKVGYLDEDENFYNELQDILLEMMPFAD